MRHNCKTEALTNDGGVNIMGHGRGRQAELFQLNNAAKFTFLDLQYRMGLCELIVMTKKTWESS